MCNVLLVDDNRDNREIYRTILEHGGHVVVEAVNGAEALPLARDGQPDVIVMDVSMPVMGGLEATKRLKDDFATRGIPIILFSAHAFTQDVWGEMGAGADAYLTKPCEPRKVLAEVERFYLVTRPSPAVPPRSRTTPRKGETPSRRTQAPRAPMMNGPGAPRRHHILILLDRGQAACDRAARLLEEGQILRHQSRIIREESSSLRAARPG